jgi:hypothetical protein
LWTGKARSSYRDVIAKTSKGHIQQLPSGSFRVKVYAGTDPVTGKERLLRQTCPDEAAAHAALGRMLAEADGGRFPDQQATLGQALGKYLEVADASRTRRPPSWRPGYSTSCGPRTRNSACTCGPRSRPELGAARSARCARTG